MELDRWLLEGHRNEDEVARLLLAVGLNGGDHSASGIARFAGIHVAEAQDALERCRRLGTIEADGSMDERLRVELISLLPLDVRAEIHATAARHWMAAGPHYLTRAIEHARAAGTLVPLEEIVEMADRGGRMSLSLGEYRAAAELLQVAVDLDSSTEARLIGERLCDLAAALDGMGNVAEARRQLARAAILGEAAGDSTLVARCAVAFALPVDWWAGDQTAAGLLARAEGMPLDEPTSIMVQAARALVEIRIPLSPEEGHQIAWITRPAVAHSLADDALERAPSHGPVVHGLALLAWRTTHRSPAVLAKRREVSQQALQHAQMLRQPTYQVESAVWLAVDALESGDRPLYDQALAVARWVAEHDGNPRLLWRAHTLSAGAAHLDGDIDEAERWRHRAREVGRAISSPGWLGADLLLLAERVVSTNDDAELRSNLLDEDFPALVNPIGRAVAAYVQARVGSPEIAERMVRRALRQLDLESSYLLLATRCTAVVEVLGSKELAQQLIGVLEPWRGHLAVDSNAWWCDGPVDLWLAKLHRLIGSDDQAEDESAAAFALARDVNDVRALEALRSTNVNQSSNPGGPRHLGSEYRLTAREREVLELMASGATNHEIAEVLSYSTSTIRVDTISIYRKLSVKGRADAVAKAIALGLLPGFEISA